MGLQTHISHRLLGSSTHTHLYTHKKLKPNDPSSPLLSPPLTVAADTVFPAGQKAFSTSLYCPNLSAHTHTHPLQHIHAGQDGVFVLFSQTAWEEGKGREG